MREEMYERQMKLMKKRTERNQLQRQLHSTKAQMEKAQTLRNNLHRQLVQKQQDIAKLGKFSVANKIAEWTGKWDHSMEQAIADMSQVEKYYKEADETATTIEKEVDNLQRTLESPDLVYIEESWEDFLKEKEAWLHRFDPVASETLQKIAEERVSIHSILREIGEAQEAGEKASRALDSALNHLDSAEGMSIWDTFLGGGFIVSALKYSEIDNSDTYIQRAQRALRHFETELMDVQNVASESFIVNKNDFWNFTDLFFDNFFSDWMVHTRITDAKEELNHVLRNVRHVLNHLARKQDELNHTLVSLERERKELIES